MRKGDNGLHHAALCSFPPFYLFSSCSPFFLNPLLGLSSEEMLRSILGQKTKAKADLVKVLVLITAGISWAPGM